MKRIVIISVLVGIICAFCGFLAAKRIYRGQSYEKIVHHTDTLIVRDSIRIDHFIEVAKKVTDSIFVAVADTVRITDTLYMALGRETKEYSSEHFRAQVSGFSPSLDWIDIFPETKTITNTTILKEKPKRWGIGIQAGYGISTNGLSPYIGIGISYDLVRF